MPHIAQHADEFALIVNDLAGASDAYCREYGEAQKSHAGASAIEQALAWALSEIFEIGGGGCLMGNEPLSFQEVRTLSSFGNSCSAPYILHVWRQVQIDRYRVDFLIAYRAGRETLSKFVVLECDGHDFHERTKEQAEHDKRRDRTLQSLGLPVMRLTGSEIWRSPIKAAWEVLTNTLDAIGARNG